MSMLLAVEPGPALLGRDHQRILVRRNQNAAVVGHAERQLDGKTCRPSAAEMQQGVRAARCLDRHLKTLRSQLVEKTKEGDETFRHRSRRRER